MAQEAIGPMQGGSSGQSIETVAKRREQGNGRGLKVSYLKVRQDSKWVSLILRNRVKKRNPLTRAEQDGCHLEASNTMPKGPREVTFPKSVGKVSSTFCLRKRDKELKGPLAASSFVHIE